jgi:1,4-dihydroxy-2-naphthoyl-CoA hydrolase
MPESIWHRPITPEALTAFCANTLVEHLGIAFTEVGPDYLRATMPVDARTHQPLGLLHGGASVALAETLGCVGAACCLDERTHYPVGMEINANHLRAQRTGLVEGTARPIHRGRSTHVWQIEIKGEGGHLVCISRITLAIREKR